MNTRYLITEESKEAIAELKVKVEEMGSTFSGLMDEIEQIEYQADEAKGSINIAITELGEFESHLSTIEVTTDEESDVDKLVKLTGKSIEELKHILRNE